jgi:uroporphyrinogen-III decarboxylase
MTETALTAALNRRNDGRPPVWMMRQAGRYHSHYQLLKRYNDFIDLCRNPELAAETAMGPIHDFNFDAAILFSDLLFPLEAMGMGLKYDPGPKLDFHLRTLADVQRLTGGAGRATHLQFQADAVRLTRARLRRMSVRRRHCPAFRTASMRRSTGSCSICWHTTWPCSRGPAPSAWRCSIRLRAR